MNMTNKIPSKTIQALVGSLLGDGTLNLSKNAINAYFRENHGIRQKEYIKWKMQFFAPLKPIYEEYKILDKRTQRYYHHAVFRTKVHPLLTKFHSLVYKKKKKYFESILKYITPLSLAIWYCDDGSYGYINQNGKLATYLSKRQNRILVKFIKEKFNINPTINKDGNHYHIYFSVAEINKFLKLIKNNVPSCMNYKLGPYCKENVERIKKENALRRERDKKRHARDMQDPVKRAKNIEWRKKYYKKQMKNPNYRKNHNEYHRLWMKKYRENNREKYNEYARRKQKELYWRKKESSSA